MYRMYIYCVEQIYFIPSRLYQTTAFGCFKSLISLSIKQACEEFVIRQFSPIKAVLFHNSNINASVHVGPSIQLKEHYENLEVFLKRIAYKDHSWFLCGDLKILGLLVIHKISIFLCEWGEELEKFVNKRAFNTWQEECSEKNLIDTKGVLLLHIKLFFIYNEGSPPKC